MGPIQGSLNQLVLSTIGAVAGVSHGIGGTFVKPKAPKAQRDKPDPETQTQSGMGNIAKIGRDYSRSNLRAYTAAARAVDYANDVILQKANARFSAKDRLKQIKDASSLSTKEEKGGSK